MIIRKAEVKDYDNIYELVKTGFETARVTDGNEQNFVYELRKRDSFVPELEFVMEDGDELIGHVMLTKQSIDCKERIVYGLLLAPLCIKLEYRNKGYGQEIMKFAFNKALEMGYDSVFLVGNPEYYNRAGFMCVNKFGIENAVKEIPDQYVLAKELNTDALKNISGSVNIH